MQERNAFSFFEIYHKNQDDVSPMVINGHR